MNSKNQYLQNTTTFRSKNLRVNYKFLQTSCRLVHFLNFCLTCNLGFLWYKTQTINY